jgi:hypothetical protein
MLPWFSSLSSATSSMHQTWFLSSLHLSCYRTEPTPIAVPSASCSQLISVLILSFVYITVYFEELRADKDIMMDFQ